jgi:sensor histidine kinase regulating citrate/malate metabolism
MNTSLSNRITTLFVVIGIIAAAAVAVVVPRLIGDLMRDEARRSAEQTVRMVKVLRGYHTKNVVAQVNKSGVLRTHYVH